MYRYKYLGQKKSDIPTTAHSENWKIKPKLVFKKFHNLLHNSPDSSSITALSMKQPRAWNSIQDSLAVRNFSHRLFVYKESVNGVNSGLVKVPLLVYYNYQLYITVFQACKSRSKTAWEVLQGRFLHSTGGNDWVIDCNVFYHLAKDWPAARWRFYHLKSIILLLNNTFPAGLGAWSGPCCLILYIKKNILRGLLRYFKKTMGHSPCSLASRKKTSLHPTHPKVTLFKACFV